jgi:hypothetical protein
MFSQKTPVTTAVSALFISMDDSVTNISNHTFVLLQNEAKVSTVTATVADASLFAANLQISIYQCLMKNFFRKTPVTATVFARQVKPQTLSLLLPYLKQAMQM